MADKIAVGSLHYPVRICRPTPQFQGTGTMDQHEELARVQARIDPLGTIAYLEGINTGHEVSHRIFVRWDSRYQTGDVVFSAVQQPDGEWRDDEYVILRKGEWQGLRRFLVLECKLRNTSS